MRQNNSIEELKQVLRLFAEERDWNQYHTPKNLVMALIVEVAELVEHFQWLTPEQSLSIPQHKKQEIVDEVADILIYLTRFSDLMEIDLLESAFQKVIKNESKYPKKSA